MYDKLFLCTDTITITEYDVSAWQQQLLPCSWTAQLPLHRAWHCCFQACNGFTLISSNCGPVCSPAWVGKDGQTGMSFWGPGVRRP